MFIPPQYPDNFCRLGALVRQGGFYIRKNGQHGDGFDFDNDRHESLDLHELIDVLLTQRQRHSLAIALDLQIQIRSVKSIPPYLSGKACPLPFMPDDNKRCTCIAGSCAVLNIAWSAIVMVLLNPDSLE